MSRPRLPLPLPLRGTIRQSLLVADALHYSLRSVSVIAGVLGRAGEQGQKRRKADAGRGLCTWNNPPDIEKWIKENKAKESAELGVDEGEEGEGGDGRGEEVEDDNEEEMVVGVGKI